MHRKTGLKTPVIIAGRSKAALSLRFHLSFVLWCASSVATFIAARFAAC